FPRGIADDLVIHVSNVHHMLQFVAALQQEASQDVHGNKGAEVSNMAVVVDRGTAGIHADGVVLGGGELFHLAGKRVVEAQGQTKDCSKMGRATQAASSRFMADTPLAFYPAEARNLSRVVR